MTDLTALRNTVAIAWIRHYRDQLPSRTSNLREYEVDSALSELQIILENATEEELQRVMGRIGLEKNH